jgi:hypothetical protein
MGLDVNGDNTGGNSTLIPDATTSGAAPSATPPSSAPTTSGAPMTFGAMGGLTDGLLSPTGNGYAGPGGTNLVQPLKQVGGLAKALGYILPGITAAGSIYSAMNQPPDAKYSTSDVLGAAPHADMPSSPSGMPNWDFSTLGPLPFSGNFAPKTPKVNFGAASPWG